MGRLLLEAISTLAESLFGRRRLLGQIRTCEKTIAPPLKRPHRGGFLNPSRLLFRIMEEFPQP